MFSPGWDGRFWRGEVVKKIRKTLEGKGRPFFSFSITIEKDADTGNFSQTLENLAKKVNEG